MFILLDHRHPMPMLRVRERWYDGVRWRRRCSEDTIEAAGDRRAAGGGEKRGAAFR